MNSRPLPTDALGNLVRFILLPSQHFDIVGVPPLIDGLSFSALIADTAFDSNTIIADLDERGAKLVIARHGAAPACCRLTAICTNGVI